jgi:hypothetical protein
MSFHRSYLLRVFTISAIYAALTLVLLTVGKLTTMLTMLEFVASYGLVLLLHYFVSRRIFKEPPT